MIKSLLLAVAFAYVNPTGLQPNVPAVQTLEQQLGIDHIGKTPAAIVAEESAALGLDASKQEPVATSEALNAFIDPTATWHLQPRDAYAMEPSGIVVDENMHPTSMDPRSGNRGRKFGLPGTDADYRKYQ